MTAPEVNDVSQSRAVVERPPLHAMKGFDPFEMMDRLDEDAFLAEMQGRVADELVYVVKGDGKEVVGLSKTGIDECCMALVTQGQVIREEDITFEIIGDGDDREALFRCRAARFAINKETGVEIRLDQVLGVKRQPLYYEPVELTLDSTVPSKKYRGKTYRDLLSDDEGRDYLGWMADNFREPEIRSFARAALDGEVIAVTPGRRLNPHWYEHGSMKAARNARSRLIPSRVKAEVITHARAAGQVRQAEVSQRPQQTQQTRAAIDPLKEIIVKPLPGKKGAWGGYAGAPMSEVPNDTLERVSQWSSDKAIEARDRNDKQEAQRLDNLTNACDLIIAARESGVLEHPKHKDGTPSGSISQQREPGDD